MSLLSKLIDDNRERIVGLDILRSIAILLVLFEHGLFLVPPENHEFYQALRLIKIDGVTIFFVLSGFLIGRILWRKIDDNGFNLASLFGFWVRRWLRTLPNYFVVLMVIFLYKIIRLEDLSTFYNHWYYFFFTQNFYTPHPPFYPEAWSLSVEEWFYLLFPLSIFFILKCKKSRNYVFLSSVFVFLLIPLIFRIAKYQAGVGLDDLDLYFRKIVILRLDSIVYGIVAAYIFHTNFLWWEKIKIPFLFFGIVAIAGFYFYLQDIYSFYFPVFFNIEALVVLCLLPWFSQLKSTGLKFANNFFILISVLSYSMYLLNFSIVQGFLLPYFEKCFTLYSLTNFSTTAVYFLYWLLTFLLAFVLYRLLERPIMKYRDTKFTE